MGYNLLILNWKRFNQQTLNRQLQWELDKEGIYTDLVNYEEIIQENCFLGSYGVKVGKYYDGMDDFLCT